MFYLKIEKIPMGLNESYKHSASRYRHAYTKKWHNHIRDLCWNKVPEQPFKYCEIKILRHYYLFRDYDNLVGGMKPLIDGLVRCKVLEDDNYALTGPWRVGQIKNKKSEGHQIELWITERTQKEVVDSYVN
jgi:hypothetical protein